MNETSFNPETPEKVKQVLELARENGLRVRLWYGDTETGKGWDEELDIIGYIGRSTGQEKIPIILYDRKSIGGPGILTHCIVRIDTTRGQTLYIHRKFDPGYWTYSKEGELFKNGEYVGKNKNEKSAKRFCQFMMGHRYQK